MKAVITVTYMMVHQDQHQIRPTVSKNEDNFTCSVGLKSLHIV